MRVTRVTAGAFMGGTAVVSGLAVAGSLWLTGALDDGDSAAAPSSQSRTETETVTVTVTSPPAGHSKPRSVTETATSSYPKLVDADSVDSRFTAGSDDLDSLVQLAPGVYAEPPASGELGELDDYSAYLGLCADAERYAKEHPGGYTCW